MTTASKVGAAVSIPAGAVRLEGFIGHPPGAFGTVLFAHGSGSGRFSPRNGYVARVLHDAGFATLLLDLLTEREANQRTLVFDIPLLAERLRVAAQWTLAESSAKGLPLGYFGASTGAAAALVAATGSPAVRAIVSRGGRPDLAGDALERVAAPTLLIVGGWDEPVVRLNELALQRLRAPKELIVVPKATHLFEEPGKLEEVSRLAAQWFGKHLARLEVP